MTTSIDATSPQPSASPSESAPKPAQKKKGPRRARRRGADDSDSGSDDEGTASDSSVSVASSVSASDSEHDSEEEGPAEEKGGKSAFPDVSSTTPAAWADDNAPTEEVEFAAFNRGENGLAIRGSAKRARGRGGAVSAEKERKPLTEEQLKRLEEKRARQKEKLKAKRKEAKEAKRKEREGKDETAANDKQPEASTSDVKLPPTSKEETSAKKGKGKGKRQDQTSAASLVDSTKALSLDAPVTEIDETSGRPSQTTDVATSRAPAGPRNNRSVRPDDPKFTPRAGGFWTHDQRHDFSAEGLGGRGSWRGRGFDRGGPRGGFRGRGRGGFVPPFARGGSVQQAGRGQELTEVTDNNDNTEGGAKTLEMDKLEAALERQKEEALRQKEEALERQKESEVESAEHPAEESGNIKEVKARPAREPKWGHEGFESLQAVAHFQANRMLRGRGRGRGFFGAARGGFVPRQPFHNLPTPDQTPEAPGAKTPAQSSAPSRPSPLNTPSTVSKTENSSTAPSAESLLESEAVTVKLPGFETATSVETIPKSQTDTLSRTNSATASSTIRASAPAFVQPKPLLAHAMPSNFSDGTASPQPYPTNGSENGSVSSGGMVGAPVFVTGAPEFFPGVNGAPTVRRPAPFYPSQQSSAPQQGQPFYPQSYSPDLYNPASRHPSFGSSGYIDARSVSPYPYAGQQGGGYYMPPRSSSKVAIKSPVSEKDSEDASKQYASIDQSVNPMMAGVQGMNGGQQYYAGHYNPYAVQGGGMYDGTWPAGEGYANGSWGYGY